MIAHLDPAHYVRALWKNGGGVSVDIASKGDAWRFGRTPITAAGPFSDYTGFDRMQVLVAGRGLVLQTPDGELDVRMPFKPVRFAGETRIVSRLEAGPVEVVNLMGDRRRVHIDLAVLNAGGTRRLGPGVHIAYCPAGQAAVRLQGAEYILHADGGLRIEDVDRAVATCSAGPIVVGSVTCVSR
ncbi:MAG TPA: HutD family protein [Reyranella sp.]|nr:HutD family protein [Reyranella sp.]